MRSRPSPTKQVLLVGYRKPIVAALEKRGVPFAIWHDRPLKRPPACIACVIERFPKSTPRIRTVVNETFGPHGPFSDVIAGTEASVLPASIARRALGARASRDATIIRCHDKILMKERMSRNGVPMTDYLPGETGLSPGDVLDRLGRPVVVKAPRSSGGRGMVMASTIDEIAPHMSRRVLLERFVDAPEMSVESFVRDGRIAFVNCTEYYVKRCANIVPAGISDAMRAEVLAINTSVIEALHITWGMTHCEYYLSDRGVLFGEIALRPPGGHVMECITLANDFDAWDAFVAGELDEPYDWSARPTVPAHHAASIVLHAGAGTLRSVSGVDEVRALPTCIKFRMLTHIGQPVYAREGAGDSTAYGLFLADSRDELRADVDRCLALIRFEIE